jgi:hypothetical protein
MSAVPPPVNPKHNPNPRIRTIIQGRNRNELLKATGRAATAIIGAHAPTPNNIHQP